MTKGIHAYQDKVGLPFKIVEEIAYSPQTNDLSAEVAKAKATKRRAGHGRHPPQRRHPD